MRERVDQGLGTWEAGGGEVGVKVWVACRAETRQSGLCCEGERRRVGHGQVKAVQKACVKGGFVCSIYCVVCELSV